MCNESIEWKLHWWELPPFMEKLNISNHKHEYFEEHEAKVDNVQGLMLEMLQKSMRVCCVNQRVAGSNSSSFSIKLVHSRRFDNQEQMLNNLTDMNTIAMPIMLPTPVAASNPTAMFIRMVDNTGMMYIAKHRDDDEMGNVVLTGFFNIWPLFLAVVIFTGYMAVLLWFAHLQQHWRSREHSTLMQNYFEWYWCAFITASTIGYGDRVPRNTTGKILMMFWALGGISLTSVFAATMTTIMTEHQSVVSAANNMKNSRVGVLAGSVERRFVMQDGASPVEYESVLDLIGALTAGTVDGIALDHYTFHHLSNSKELDGLDYEVAATPGITVGYILFAEERHELLNCLRLQAFLNELNVDSTIMRSFSHANTGRELNDEAAMAVESTARSIVTSQMRKQLVVLSSVYMLILVCIGIADLCLYRCRAKNSKLSHLSHKSDGADTDHLASNACYHSTPLNDHSDQLQLCATAASTTDNNCNNSTNCTSHDDNLSTKAALCARCAYHCVQVNNSAKNFN